MNGGSTSSQGRFGQYFDFSESFPRREAIVSKCVVTKKSDEKVESRPKKKLNILLCLAPNCRFRRQLAMGKSPRKQHIARKTRLEKESSHVGVPFAGPARIPLPSSPSSSSTAQFDTMMLSKQQNKLKEVYAKRRFFHSSSPLQFDALREEFAHHPTLEVHFNDAVNYEKGMMDFEPNLVAEKVLVCVLANHTNRLKVRDFSSLPEFKGWSIEEAVRNEAGLREMLGVIDEKTRKAREKAGLMTLAERLPWNVHKDEEEGEGERMLVERAVNDTRGQGEISQDSNGGAVASTSSKSVLAGVATQVSQDTPEPIILSDSLEPKPSLPTTSEPKHAAPSSPLLSKQSSSSLVNGSTGDIMVETEVKTTMEVDSTLCCERGIVEEMEPTAGACPREIALSETPASAAPIPADDSANAPNGRLAITPTDMEHDSPTMTKKQGKVRRSYSRR